MKFIYLLQRKLLKYSYPVLRVLILYYLSKPRSYRYKNIKMTIMPGVFHPGFFYSTKVFLRFIEQFDLQGKKVLELGAGSGLISLFAARQKAQVTASDINLTALEGLKNNAIRNQLIIKTIDSDIFDKISHNNFDYIFINPPYYPKQPQNDAEKAWYCGKNFDYFVKLFEQLKIYNLEKTMIYMILNEDCKLFKINQLAHNQNIVLKLAYKRYVNGELNMIFKLFKGTNNTAKLF